MNLVVIDGQGGRMGSLFIEKCRQKLQDKVRIVAVGTNSIATSSMLKAGADAGATGENAVAVNARTADYIAGPIGILAADALLGEITQAMAYAVAASPAVKVLLPVNTCNFRVAGVGNYSLNELMELAVEQIGR